MTHSLLLEILQHRTATTLVAPMARRRRSKFIREYCEMAQEKEQEIKAVWRDLLQAGAGA
jgi:hypothetical protein